LGQSASLRGSMGASSENSSVALPKSAATTRTRPSARGLAAITVW
jgi:hypothetical protein